MIKLEFTSRPVLLPMYVKCFLPKGKSTKVVPLPALEAVWNDATANFDQLPGYRSVCGYTEDEELPLLYPYVMTMPMQMSLMTHAAFPLKPLGAIHMRNLVLQQRPIRAEERMQVRCSIGASRVVKQGLEYDFNTVIEINGARVWECVSTYLSRGKFGEAEEPAASARLSDMETSDAEVSWKVGADLGRKYARVSGDYNVIHVSSLLAKLFGFPKAIIHGMWSAAKCHANLAAPSTTDAVRYLTVFKGPILLGSSVTMKSQSGPDGVRFDVYAKNNPRPCICGLLTTQAPGTYLIS